MKLVHVGVVGDGPSGMAQVVNEFMSWDITGVEQSAIASTRGRHDILAPVLLVRALLRLAARSVAGQVDTVAVHLSEGGSFVREGLIVAFSRILGLRTVVHLHGASFVAFAESHRWLVRAVLRQADAVIVLTDQTRDVVSSLVPTVTVAVVPNAVAPPQEDQSAEKANWILFAGEIGKRKGADILLAAWAVIADDRHDWELHLAGPDVEGYAREFLRLAGVTYHGVLTRAEVGALAQRTQVAVLPSREEALPMFLLETMARHNAVISTSVGQIPQLVGDAGILVMPADVAELTGALRSVTEGSLDIGRLAQAAADRVTVSYSPEHVKGVLTRLWKTGRGQATV